jgi:hypothetical protein
MNRVRERTMHHVTAGNTALSVFQTERAPRRAPKAAPAVRRRKAPALLVGSWALAIGFAMLLIYRNWLVAQETAAITQVREEINLLETQNRELEVKLVQAASVTEVERWAQARGMVRPVTVKPLAVDPGAVARPEQAEAQKAQPKGFWSSLADYIARMGSGNWSAHE